MEMIEVKTSDLIGRALDWAVAGAGHDPHYWGRLFQNCVLTGKAFGGLNMKYAPSTEWNDGGPLIDRHMLRVYPHVETNGVVTSWAADMTWPCDTVLGLCGSTALVAACRLIVMKQIGPVVQVPKELMP